MPFIADDRGRMVLLHGAIPGGLIDFWSGPDPSNTNPAPLFPIDTAAYATSCPDNFATIRMPPLCQADLAQMAGLGFNSVRLPLSWSLLEPERGKFSQAYVDRVAQVVDWAKALGIYVIVDMHQNAYSRYISAPSKPPLPGGTPVSLQYHTGAPAWATITDGMPSESYLGQREINPTVLEANSNFWNNTSGIQDEYIAAVGVLVKRFKDDSAVAGYSLFNEPWPGWSLPPTFEDMSLFPFYRRVIDAVTGAHDGLPCPSGVFMPASCGYRDLGIRDQRHLFFMDTGLLREVTDFPTHLGLPISSYPNLVLAIHAYTHIYTFDALLHQEPDKATYPWGGYDQSYSLAEREAKAINAALFVAEFGDSPSRDSLIVKNQLLQQEKHLSGFAFWSWKENCGASQTWGVYEGVFPDGKDSSCAYDHKPGERDLTVKPQNLCLRRSREQLLARVYPTAVADPRLTYHYDSDSGAFAMRATGRLSDAPTVVYVPHEVAGAITASGAAQILSNELDEYGGRRITVSPTGGAYTISVAAAPLSLTGCAA